MARLSEYEKWANEFAASAIRALTYLNGGALVVLPTGAALFKTDVDKVQTDLLAAAFSSLAGCYWCSLSSPRVFCLCQTIGIGAARCNGSGHCAEVPKAPPRGRRSGLKRKDFANLKWRQSLRYRVLALATFGLSVCYFMAGCWFARQALLQPGHAPVPL